MYGLFITMTTEDKYFTNLKEVFDVLGSISRQYNWLLSDYDCNIYPSEKIPVNELFVWLSGDELVNILREREIQLIWGVLTAYTKDITPDEVLRYPYPIAEDYEGFWNTDIKMQNPLADFEMISIDSTFFSVIARTKELIDKFAKRYPNSIDLIEYNRSIRERYDKETVNPS